MSTTVQDPRIVWLRDLVEAKPNIDAAEKVLDLKKSLIDQAQKAIEMQIGKIDAGQSFKVKSKGGGSLQSKSMDHDPNKEFDSGHDMRNSKGLDGDASAALMNAQSVIVEQSNILRNAEIPGESTAKATGKPLFTEKEIAEAIWTPLLRRNIIPENAIPDRYSDFANAFKGANEYYQEALEEYAADNPISKWDDVTKALGVGKDLFNLGVSVATNTLQIVTSVVPHANTTDVSTAISLISAIGSGTFDVAIGASTLASKVAKKQVTQDDFLSLAKTSVTAATTIVTQAVAGQSKEAQEIGLGINMSLELALDSVTFAAKMAKKDYKGALSAAAQIAATGCTTVEKLVKTEAGKSELSHLAEQVEDAFTKGKSASDFAVVCEQQAKTESPNMEAIKTALEKVMHDVGETVAKAVTALDKSVKKREEEKTSSGGSTSGGDMATILRTLQSGTKEDVDALMKDFADDESLVTAIKDLKKATEQQKQDLSDALGEDAKKENDREGQEYRTLLRQGDTGNPEQDTKVIEEMIAQIKRDQALVQLAYTLLQLGPKGVGLVFPPAKLVSVTIDIVKQLHRAINHYRAWMEWSENVDDAKSMMSLQAEAMANRAGLSLSQGNEQTINALQSCIDLLLTAMKITGTVLTHVPHTAAAGAAVNVVAGVGTAVFKIGTDTRALVTKYYKEVELSSAWKMYQSALANPDDRKLARAALRSNPTLAKYAIAYGALYQGDAVARNAMGKCGLSDEVLDNPSVNAKKVVAYMQALYPEDPQLLRPTAKNPGWHPGPVELTSDSVMTFFVAAERKAGAKAGQGKPVIDALVTAEAQMRAVKEQQVALLNATTATGQVLREMDTDHKTIDQSEDGKTVETDETGLTDQQREQMQNVLAEEAQARQSLQGTLQSVIGTLGELLAAMDEPVVNDNNKPHEQMQAYLDSLKPAAIQLRTQYRRSVTAIS